MSFLWNISFRCQQRSLPSFGLGEGRMPGPFPLQPPTQGGQSRQPHSLPPSPRSPGGCCRLSSIVVPVAAKAAASPRGAFSWPCEWKTKLRNLVSWPHRQQGRVRGSALLDPPEFCPADSILRLGPTWPKRGWGGSKAPGPASRGAALHAPQFPSLSARLSRAG